MRWKFETATPAATCRSVISGSCGGIFKQIPRWRCSHNPFNTLSFESARKRVNFLRRRKEGENHKWGFLLLLFVCPRILHPKRQPNNVGWGQSGRRTRPPTVQTKYPIEGICLKFSLHYSEITARHVAAGGSFKSYRFFSPHPTLFEGLCVAFYGYFHRKLS